MGATLLVHGLRAMVDRFPTLVPVVVDLRTLIDHRNPRKILEKAHPVPLLALQGVPSQSRVLT